MDPKIKRLFRIVARTHGNSIETQYYAPFNALLTGLFPISEDYAVGPQVLPFCSDKATDAHGVIDYLTCLVVQKVVPHRLSRGGPLHPHPAPVLPKNELADCCPDSKKAKQSGPQATNGTASRFQEEGVADESGIDAYIKPIFFLAIRPASHIHDQVCRGVADQQIRHNFARNVFESVADELGGEFEAVSAIGTKLAFYSYDTTKRRTTPIHGPVEPGQYVRGAPLHWWGVNLMQEEGYREFLSVIERAKERARRAWS
ncbi:hypothetical protein HDV00_001708 [Rhizophlyctis rosea]|nr:hypothetical protein HDV00_001708 [Rhizophlyctis rosea]